MPEIRAQKLSPGLYKKFQDLQDIFGTSTVSGTIEVLINLGWAQYYATDWAAMKRKAAHMVTTSENFSIPLSPADIKQVQIKDGVVAVWTRFQGAPYHISLESWEAN